MTVERVGGSGHAHRGRLLAIGHRTIRRASIPKQAGEVHLVPILGRGRQRALICTSLRLGPGLTVRRLRLEGCIPTRTQVLSCLTDRRHLLDLSGRAATDTTTSAPLGMTTAAPLPGMTTAAAAPRMALSTATMGTATTPSGMLTGATTALAIVQSGARIAVNDQVAARCG